MYFLTAAERLNDTNIIRMEEAVKYLSEVTDRTFQIWIFLPMTVH